MAWGVRLAPLAGLTVAVGSWSRLPQMRLWPAVAGLLCWTAGNYLCCPLRWRAVSSQRLRFGWYARVYAEAELLGMLTPQHAGADLWRVRQLTHRGARRAAAVVEVAADRLAGGTALVLVAVATGRRLVPRMAAGPTLAVVAALVLAVAVLALAVAVGSRRPGARPCRAWARLLVRWRALPRPGPRRLAAGVGLSLLYQAGYLGYTVGLVAAVGHHLDPLPAATVLGLSQLAGLLPGLHGAGPREGAMAAGLVALGLPLAAALAAVALGAALAWVPAVTVGGVGLLARRLRRPGPQPADPPTRPGPGPAAASGAPAASVCAAGTWAPATAVCAAASGATAAAVPAPEPASAAPAGSSVARSSCRGSVPLAR